MKKEKKGKHIEVIGACQNNLRGFDVDIPHGKICVVTGPSGSGKTSLAFQTIYAEGQRRYVETFSPYVRQFMERMAKPDVKEIRNVPPAIAIRQIRQSHNTRSTVGTMTEINDYLKLFFAQISEAHCLECGRKIHPTPPEKVAQNLINECEGEKIEILAPTASGKNTSVEAFFQSLVAEGFLRLRVYGEYYRSDEPKSFPKKKLPALIEVSCGRLKARKEDKSRLIEAIENAYKVGKNYCHAVTQKRVYKFCQTWACPECREEIIKPTPSMFTFNSPIGACKKCRGFGMSMGVDYRKAIEDERLSLKDGAVKAFNGKRYGKCYRDLLRFARENDIDINKPFRELSKKEMNFVFYGEFPEIDGQEAWQNGYWYGVKGFFAWLEKKRYAQHVRMFLARYRSYSRCDACDGSRIKAIARRYKINGKTLPELWQMPISDLKIWFSRIHKQSHKTWQKATKRVYEEIANRLDFLLKAGLPYLSLDREAKTLSGGETQRVELSACLGASLAKALFVLDEPSIGLHSRDVNNLQKIIRNLRDKGNTVLIVEHDESIIRSADYLVDIGVGAGEKGGNLLYAGTSNKFSAKVNSLTADYLFGKKSIKPFSKLDGFKLKEKTDNNFALQIRGARAHNLRNLDIDIPLGKLVCLSGVSGSGKSTLALEIIYKYFDFHYGFGRGDKPQVDSIRGCDFVDAFDLVNQKPLARTPRSTPVVFIGAFDIIRELFASSERAKAEGLSAGTFSFNSRDGRCGSCYGAGSTIIELQFLSDITLLCSECGGKRYNKIARAFKLKGKSVSEVLEMTASQAKQFFAKRNFPEASEKKLENLEKKLSLLEMVGLEYLRLGQSLSELSGGESQRLKLAERLAKGKVFDQTKNKRTTLLIFDEPTTGLHFHDINKLLQCFRSLLESGHSLLVIEHNLDVLKCADHIIDLGPEGGEAGGQVVAVGSPKELAQLKNSATGRCLHEQVFKSKRSRASLKVAEDTGTFQPNETSEILVEGARSHNLRNLDVSIPLNKFVGMAGLSGSGKSTLAFDILHAEGQRRFLDSATPFARQYVEQLERAEVDRVSNLPPTVAIEQRTSRGGAKSTVGTVTEIYHFLRLLYAKIGKQHCPRCNLPTGAKSYEELEDFFVSSALEIAATNKGRSINFTEFYLHTPLVKGRKGYHKDAFAKAETCGADLLFVDDKFYQFDKAPKLSRFKEHWVDAVFKVIEKGKKVPTRAELARRFRKALGSGDGTLRLLQRVKGKVKEQNLLSAENSCYRCGDFFEELEPRFFSYNSVHGRCPRCRGFGEVLHDEINVDEEGDYSARIWAEIESEEAREITSKRKESRLCPLCNGRRLNPTALAVLIKGTNIAELSTKTCVDLREFLLSWDLSKGEEPVAREVMPEVISRLAFMENVGLGYLSLERGATTLSGGEAQRVRLASQLGSNLCNALYILDEPSIGLHPRDTRSLLDSLLTLRDKGNSLLVVEHDLDTLLASDWMLDLGPGAGRFGGQLTGQGAPEEFLHSGAFPKSLTARYMREPMAFLSNEEIATDNFVLSLPLRLSKNLSNKRGAKTTSSKKAKAKFITVVGARANNLQDIDIKLPTGKLTVFCGVSGAGKSTAMMEVLLPALERKIKKKRGRNGKKTWRSVTFDEEFRMVYVVDQSPIGKTSRSTPATYVKAFDEVRRLYATTPEAKMLGFNAGRFSFNNKSGYCENCKGSGRVKIEMHFLPPAYAICDSCEGKRYNEATLQVRTRDKNIADILAMSFEEARDFFKNHKKIFRPLDFVCRGGAGYLSLGQASNTLSGGEAQRMKLAAELARGGEAERRGGRNVYLIEEPSIGLHSSDTRNLIALLKGLSARGHTVVVIEHHLDIIAEADHIIEFGPEAGESGGLIVNEGSPRELADSSKGHTAPFLRKIMAAKDSDSSSSGSRKQKSISKQ